MFYIDFTCACKVYEYFKILFGYTVWNQNQYFNTTSYGDFKKSLYIHLTTSSSILKNAYFT